jgi:hypothetical protein
MLWNHFCISMIKLKTNFNWSLSCKKLKFYYVKHMTPFHPTVFQNWLPTDTPFTTNITLTYGALNSLPINWVVCNLLCRSTRDIRIVPREGIEQTKIKHPQRAYNETPLWTSTQMLIIKTRTVKQAQCMQSVVLVGGGEGELRRLRWRYMVGGLHRTRWNRTRKLSQWV